MSDNNRGDKKAKKTNFTKISGVENAWNFAPSIIQATGNIIGGYFSGKGSTVAKVEEKVKKLKNSSWFHWILLIGIGVIAIGAFINGIEKIYKVLSTLLGKFPCWSRLIDCF